MIQFAVREKPAYVSAQQGRHWIMGLLGSLWLLGAGTYCQAQRMPHVLLTNQSSHVVRPPAPSRVTHVVLISLDGSRPDFYMDDSWDAPHLKELKRRGVYASHGIRSVFPSITYPSHTTLVTGAYPVRHGIYYNTPMGGKPGHWYWNADAIRCPTLWDGIRAAHLSSGAVMWPVTVGAPIDYNFPVRRPEQGETADLLTVKLPYITPPGLLEEMSKKTGRKLSAADLVPRDYRQSKTIARISDFIIRTYKPNLMAIHFVGIDHQEHKYGRNAPEVKQMVRVTDSLVGTVLQAIQDAGIADSTAVIVTGDHGFADNQYFLKPNVYLDAKGLDKPGDWKARFKTTGGSAFLYLRHPKDRATLRQVVDILKHTSQYEQGCFRIVGRKELDRMGANPEVALALAMREGVVARPGAKGPVFGVDSTGGNHGYDPGFPDLHTGFLAAGAGIGTHADITGMGIVDVAPLVARLLGIPFHAPDGKIIPGILAGD